MNLEKIHQVYFIGIGGIGMSALARYFVAKGFAVAGYDKTESEITRALTGLGVSIHFEDDIDHIDTAFLDLKTTQINF